jgi:DtxR family Mn-dependent transcriptional regulator
MNNESKVSLSEYSKTEQDYLKAIYQLRSEERELVGINEISSYLGVAAPSVTEMIKRLAAKELVDYQKYKGAALKPLGYQEARFILKSHRVWETFLVQKAGYQLDEVHDEAENLEHASSRKLIERLYALLDYPQQDPHGSEIPSEVFWKGKFRDLDLSGAKVGKRYETIELSRVAKQYLKDIAFSGEVTFLTLVKVLKDGTQILKTDDNAHLTVPTYLQGDWSVRLYD